MVAAFHLHCLEHRVNYGNPEVGNTAQQFLLTIRPYCSIEFIESFLFWVILVEYNIGIYICTYIYKVSYIHSFLLPSTVMLMFFLHCMQKILRYEKIFCKTNESIASSREPSSAVIFLGVHSEYKKTVFPLVSLSLAYRWVNQPRYLW